jgi:hypothetical protein
MRWRLLGLLLLAALPSNANAASVIVLGSGGRAVVRNDPFLTSTPVTPLPSGLQAVAARHRSGPRRPPERTMRSELVRLYRIHAINRADYRRYSASFNTALATVRRLKGTRALELESVVQNLHQIAATGMLTTSRLPALFLTLDRNRQWWTTGPLLNAAQRVEFAGSGLVWQYYPGQGIELQVLGSFGRADGLYTAGPTEYSQMRALLTELIPLAAIRSGGLTWEYYFSFDGGAPPWTSAMSQGTALEALARAYQAFGDGRYLTIASRALSIFQHGPPAGVSMSTQLGRRYLQYSFAPDAAIINAFLQTLIGLYDYAHVSGNQQAARLFAAGDAEALAEVPHYDTGAWSLYEPGQEDTLDYHVLVTGFLHALCTRTGAPVYCTTAAHFDSDLTTPPSLKLLTVSARTRKTSAIRFWLSKYSRVGIVLLRGTRTVFTTSADFPYGVSEFSIPKLTAPGSYTVRLAATDLAGNFNRIIATLPVSR